MAHQYLTFTLDTSLFALEVFKVQEVLVYKTPVKIPCSAPYVEGLINSRDNGIPVIDLRKKFHLSEVAPSKDTRIIVMEIKRPTQEDVNHISTFGATVDCVQEVLALEDSQIEPPPKFGNTISAEFILGLAKNEKDEFIILLDAEKIFSTSDLENYSV